MMAAFIIAVRGPVGQAVLLALAATLSHTAIVWAIALGGMYFGQSWNAEANEPWLQLASGLMIVAVALWMIGRTWSDRRGAAHPHDHHHDHGHDHHHHDHDHHHHHHHHEPLPAACHHDHHHPVHSEIGDELNAPGVGYQDPHERAHAADIRRRFKRSLEHLLADYLPLANRWIVWDSRVLPAKRLAISGINDIESVRQLIAP